MLIEITYNVTDVYMSTTETPVYVEISFEQPGGGAAVWGGITGTLSNQTDLQTALDLKVPYSGATGDVSLGEFGINLGNVIYDTTPTGIPTDQGATYWDADAETVALIMNGTIQKIGEDTFYHVRNTTGSTIPKGTAVRFAGTTGNSGRLLIEPMLANGTYPSQYYMGITSEDLVNNADGKVYHFGKMRNVNTSAFADGDVLYVSPSVAGALTATAPVAPNNIIVAAAVVHAANNGTLMIRTTLGSNINTDEGVLITTPTANQGLFYDSGLWVNKSIPTALGYTPANAATTLTINGVTYDLSTSRTWTISAGISGTIATGQVAYATAANTIGGSNNLFWDNANNGLKLNNGDVIISGDTSNLSIGRFASVSNNTVTIWANQNGGIPLLIKSYNNNTIYTFNSSGEATFNGYLRLRSATAVAGIGLTVQSSGAGFPAVNIYGNTSQTGNLLEFKNSTGTILSGFNSAANLFLGSATDLGVRLGVVGDTLLRGSGATSATTALTVQNSSSTNLFTVNNAGVVSVNQTFTATANGQNFTGFLISSTNNFGAFTSCTSTPFQVNYPSGEVALSVVQGSVRNLTIGGGTTSNLIIRSLVQLQGIAGSNTAIFNTTTFAFRIEAGGRLGVRDDGTNAFVNSSSLLELTSTTKGFLPPRMTTTQKNAIATPAAGLVVYDTTDNKHYGYDGTTWNAFY